MRHVRDIWQMAAIYEGEVSVVCGQHSQYTLTDKKGNKKKRNSTKAWDHKTRQKKRESGGEGLAKEIALSTAAHCVVDTGDLEQKQERPWRRYRCAIRYALSYKSGTCRCDGDAYIYTRIHAVVDPRHGLARTRSPGETDRGPARRDPNAPTCRRCRRAAP